MFDVSHQLNWPVQRITSNALLPTHLFVSLRVNRSEEAAALAILGAPRKVSVLEFRKFASF